MTIKPLFHFLLLVGFLCAQLGYAQSEKPNVIIIMADDLGWADVAIQNEAASVDVVTPHIDALFRSGLRFTNGYVANATCGPSRASLMTGRTSSRFGMEDNIESGLPTSEIVIPQIIKKAGYTSGIIGKWHLGHEPEQMPLAKGFDEFYGLPGGNHHYFSKPLLSGTEEVSFEGYLTDVLAEKSVEFIERNKEKPFFLYAAFNAPHSPMMATQRDLERIVKHQPRFEPAYERIKKVEGRNALPNFIMENFRSPDADSEVMRLTYCAMVAALDEGFGKIMAAVDAAGIRENTLVVFLSDNGAALARPTDFGGVNLPLRSGKGTIWDGGVRVVFGASWPGTIPAGGAYDGIVNATDLFTTTVELADESVPDDRVIDGVNLIPYLTGEKKGNPHDEFFFRRHDRGNWSFRSGDFKWVSDRKTKMPPDGELYKISEDESESTDVSEQYPEKKAEMMKRYEELTKDLPAPTNGDSEEESRPRSPRRAKAEKSLLLSDDFDSLKHPGRKAQRGDWQVTEEGLVCTFDKELYKKFNAHGPILNYDLPHQDAEVSYAFKVTGSEAVTFTTNADKGHVFRFVITPDGYNARAFPPEGEKKSIAVGRGKVPALASGEWVDVSFTYQGDQVVVKIGPDFEKTFQDPSFARQKKNLSVSFTEGTFAIRNLEVKSESARPNVVLIFIDDMGYGDVGYNGVKGARTPNVDQMAAEGMIFDDFYVDCAVCTGSRAAILTGTRYQRLGMKKVLFPHDKEGLNPDEVTIADMLKPLGYQTACIGKWHLGHLPPCLPTYQGFDTYFGIPYSNDMWIDPANTLADNIVLREGVTMEDLRAGKKIPFTVPLMEGEEIVEYPADQSTLTKRYTERSVAFIKENKDQPFFLYLPHSMVHKPLAVSEEFQGRTDTLLGDAIEELDWSVGQILDTLKQENLSENTLVIFTSDNGAAMGSSLPFRAKKASVYDGGMREPTVMWWPGQIPAGTVSEELVVSVDLLPTIAGLTRAELPERKIDGIDIRSLMTGDKEAEAPRDTYVFTHDSGTVRSGKWKFYPWSEKGGKDKGGKVKGREPSSLPVQLYDTDADIAETRNLSERFPEVVETLQTAYDATMTDVEASSRSMAKMVRPAGASSASRPAMKK